MIYLLCTILLSCSALGSDPLDPKVIQSAIVAELTTIDATSTELKDLAPLVKLIGPAHVVQLGERGHGDGSSYEARTRIAKFLHSEMGFDVIVLESPYFGMMRTNLAIMDGEPLAGALAQGVGVWWRLARQMQPLFKYIEAQARTSHPIVVAGGDSQIDKSEAELLVKMLTEFFEHHDPGWLSDSNRKQLALLPAALGFDGGPMVTLRSYTMLRDLLSELRLALTRPSHRLRATTSPVERIWWDQLLDVTEQGLEDRAIRGFAPPFAGDFQAYFKHPAPYAGQNRRDRGISNTVIRLAEDIYPGRKIIVWIANSHAHEFSEAVKEGNEDFDAVRIESTGTYLAGYFGPELFTLLTTKYKGQQSSPSIENPDGTVVWTDYVVPPAKKGTIEHALHELGITTAILDVSRSALRVKHSRMALPGEPERSIADFADALLFIDDMQPSTPIESFPAK